MKKENIKKLVLSAVMVALATVLSFIKLYELPYGGSITLVSMLPIVMICLMCGTGWGITAGFVYSLIQFAQEGFALNWALSAGVWVICAIFDYLLPFTLLGVAGVFRKKGVTGIAAGVTLAMVLRFACHFITGFTIWRESAAAYGFGSPVLYSLCYNGSYMLPELIITVVATVIIFKVSQINKLIAK